MENLLVVGVVSIATPAVAAAIVVLTSALERRTPGAGLQAVRQRARSRDQRG